MKKKKIGCFVTAIFLMLGSAITAHAEDYTGRGDMEVSFSGDKMESTFQSSQISDEARKLQPGDSVTFQVKLKNNGAQAMDWYMTNEVLKSLEESSSRTNGSGANGGAYTYVLSYTQSGANGSRVLYSSESVGGEKTAALGVGLHEASDSLEDFFYLDTLEAGKSGAITLKIALDGETQGNAYQKTLARLQMNFAVEEATQTAQVTENKGGTTRKVTQKKVIYTVGAPQTGDTSNLLLWSGLALAGGVITLLLGFAGYRKGGQGHEDA